MWKIGKIEYENGLIDYQIVDTNKNQLADGFVEQPLNVNNIISVGEYLFKDYKWQRARLQELNYDLLTPEEKIIVCQNQAKDEDTSKQVLGTEYRNFRTLWSVKSIACRKDRFQLALTIFTENVSLIDRYNVLGYLNTIPTLKTNYEEHGVEGTLDGNPIEGIINFVDATIGGAFETTGIRARTFTMVGALTKDEMCDLIIYTLRNGR